MKIRTGIDNIFNNTTSCTKQCSVCNGMKIISELSGLPPSYQIVNRIDDGNNSNEDFDIKREPTLERNKTKTKIKTNDSATPISIHSITERTLIATEAMNGLLGNRWFVGGHHVTPDEKLIAEFSVKMADALINELNKTEL